MTRMWMIAPSLLCRKHLLGEHCEIHKAYGGMMKDHKIDRYLSDGLLEPIAMKDRHDEIALEMQKRGYNHKSDFTVQMQENVIDYMINKKYSFEVYVNKAKSIIDLSARCEECKANIYKEN